MVDMGTYSRIWAQCGGYGHSDSRNSVVDMGTVTGGYGHSDSRNSVVGMGTVTVGAVTATSGLLLPLG